MAREMYIKIFRKLKADPNFNIMYGEEINYVYVLTPKGIAEKTKLTINFMKRKMAEYDELKSELNRKENVDNN